MPKPKKEKFRRASRTTVPEGAHPLARVIFGLMREYGVTYDELSWRSGVLCSTIKAWRKTSVPGLTTAEATLGVFGWSLVPVPPLKDVPPEIAAELERLAEEWRGINPALCQLLANVCRAPLGDPRAPRPTERAPHVSRPQHQPALAA